MPQQISRIPLNGWSVGNDPLARNFQEAHNYGRNGDGHESMGEVPHREQVDISFPKGIKLEFPIFGGMNPAAWIYQSILLVSSSSSRPEDFHSIFPHGQGCFNLVPR